MFTVKVVISIDGLTQCMIDHKGTSGAFVVYSDFANDCTVMRLDYPSLLGVCADSAILPHLLQLQNCRKLVFQQLNRI